MKQEQATQLSANRPMRIVDPQPHDLNGTAELLLQALATVESGLLVTDPAGRVLWANTAARDLLGNGPEPVRGHPLANWLRDPQLSVFWDDALASRETLSGLLSATWPQRRNLRVSASAVLDGAGQVVARTLQICDVTAVCTVQVQLSQAVAERLLSLTSGHMPPEPVARLTHQELRVLRLLGRGISNDKIAETNGVSASTVRSHLKSLYRKLNLASRAEAVSFAIRHHLV